jgi:hypothetical protein
MSKSSIKHLENLIRVVNHIPDDQFNLSHCHQCAIGHASRDEYFIAAGFKPGFPALEELRDFFDIDMRRISYLFFARCDYGSRMDVLAALRVLLLEKMAQQSAEEWGGLTAKENAELEVAELS